MLGDAIKVDWVPFDVLISNTPYQVCRGNFWARNLEAKHQSDLISFGFQDARHAQAASSGNPHVPARIRPETGGEAGRQALRPVGFPLQVGTGCVTDSPTRLSVNANFWATCSNVMKVSKANFRPPPQVDSCVVRIVPKQGAERPTISFEEFDGLLRIVSHRRGFQHMVVANDVSQCFNRKNRTMRASWLGTKEVLQMLEKVSRENGLRR